MPATPHVSLLNCTFSRMWEKTVITQAFKNESRQILSSLGPNSLSSIQSILFKNIGKGALLLYLTSDSALFFPLLNRDPSSRHIYVILSSPAAESLRQLQSAELVRVSHHMYFGCVFLNKRATIVVNIKNAGNAISYAAAAFCNAEFSQTGYHNAPNGSDVIL